MKAAYKMMMRMIIVQIMNRGTEMGCLVLGMGMRGNNKENKI